MKHFILLCIALLSVVSLKAQTYVRYSDGDGKYVNMRQEPNGQAPIITRMTDEDDATLITRQGKWLKVNWMGNVGWVHADHCAVFDDGFINMDNFYDTASTRKIYPAELNNLSAEQMNLARNEIYARHGYIFKKKELRDYFSQFAWYNPRYTDVQKMLSKVEVYNVELLYNLCRSPKAY